jgi:hypothetical protein
MLIWLLTFFETCKQCFFVVTNFPNLVNLFSDNEEKRENFAIFIKKI